MKIGGTETNEQKGKTKNKTDKNLNQKSELIRVLTEYACKHHLQLINCAKKY